MQIDSSALALKRYGVASYFLQRQVFHLLAGLALMTILAWWDYQRLRTMVWPALALVLLGLALVFVPGLSHEVGGAAQLSLYLGYYPKHPPLRVMRGAQKLQRAGLYLHRTGEIIAAQLFYGRLPTVTRHVCPVPSQRPPAA